MNAQPLSNLPVAPVPVQAPLSAMQNFHLTNYLQQLGSDDFQATHKIVPDGIFPIWDVRQQVQPNVRLGPFENPNNHHIGRVIYGVPKQYSVNHGYGWDYQDLVDQGFQPDFINAVLATEALHAHNATLEEIDNMRLWGISKQNGIQYVPAALCPEINEAARSGNWYEANQAAKRITAAGAVVVFDHDERPDVPREDKQIDTSYYDEQNGVKRPPNSWILYRRDAHKQIIKLYPKMKNTDISKVVSLMWKRERDQVKKYYIDFADEINQSFRQQNPNYRFSPRRPGERQRRAARASAAEANPANATQATIQNAANAAQDAQDAAQNAQDAAQDVQDAAQDAQVATQDAAQGAAQDAAQPLSDYIHILAQIPAPELFHMPATVTDAVDSDVEVASSSSDIEDDHASDIEDDQMMEVDNEDMEGNNEDIIRGLTQEVIQDFIGFFQTGEIA